VDLPYGDSRNRGVNRAFCVVATTVLLAGCGAAEREPTSPPGAAHQPPSPAPSPRPQAVVTAENEDRLVSVDLASGRIERRIAPAADPEFVAAGRRVAVVVSPETGAVTLLDSSSLRPIKVLRGFGSPHIAEISPDGRYAYVTDDARGQLVVIRLSDGRLLARIPVGAQAHHLTVRPDGRQVWLALGESARTIVIVDTSDAARPRVVDRFDPGFPAHDVRFTPDARRVWITSSSTEDVGVFSARSHRLLFHVAGGAPPQHVAFDGRRAYVTSGYGRQIESVSLRTGRVLKVAPAPYGSFNLDVADGFVVTASLLRGKVAVYDDRLRPLRILRVAPAARDVAIWPPSSP
jgi:DNA-binding beta-propeller fold protein YncE